MEVVDDDDRPVRLGGARERFVLAMLLLGADRLVPAERLIDGLWDEPPPTARQQLQNLIAGLRRRLARHDPQLVVTRPFGYELRLGPHRLDLREFRHHVAEARALDLRVDAPGIVSHLEAGIALWRGPALGDVAPTAADSSTEALRQALREERIAAVDLLVDALAHLGRHEDVLTTTAAHLEDDPWNERLHEQRLRALAATGRRSEASETYLRLRRRFIDELGVPPSQTLADLNTQILEGSPIDARSTARRPGVPRELPAPTWTLVGREALLGAVLTRLAPRVGARATSVGEAARAAAPPALVVLVGVGGVGKSALAVTAGHALADAYPDGTLFASFDDGSSGTVEPHIVIGRFLRALGVDGANVPSDPEARLGLYRSTVAGKRVLTVIDGATSESQVRPLLPTSPGAGAIVTSRSKLAGLVGVRRHTVPRLSAEDGLALLADIAGPERELGDDAEVLAEISSLCGHLPLALCVAGSKLATNTALDLAVLRDRLTQEHARLDELSVGDIDVRASISLSVEDLAPSARALFRRLSVAPAADWPAWVARLLLRGITREIEAHHALDELVDWHLVEPAGRDAAGQPRYRMHSLVSELAAEYLANEEGEGARAELTRGVISAWLELAAIADERLDDSSGGTVALVDGPDGAAAAATAPSDWFESERTNLVRAVLAAAALDDADLAARLALTINTFLTIRAYDDDRERVLLAALDVHAPDGPSAPTAGAAHPGDAEAAPEWDAEVPAHVDAVVDGADHATDAAGAGDPRQHLDLLGALFAVLAQRHRDEELPAVAATALESARRTGDPALVQRALSQSGWAAMTLHRFDEALHWYDLASRLADERDDRVGRIRAGAQRGVVLRNMGRAAEGDPLLEAMVAQARAGESKRTTSIWLATRAEGLIDLSRWDDAHALLTEALDLAEEIRDDLGEAYCRLALGRVHLGRGDVPIALEQLGLARKELDARAGDGGDPDVLRLEVDVLATRGEWGPAETDARRLVTRRRQTRQPLELASDLARLAHIQRASGADAGALAAESEAAAILGDLALPRAALRLTTPPYGPAHGLEA